MTNQPPASLPGFASLNSNTSLHEPSERQQHDDEQPDLVILCSWGWALRKYITKYTDGYQALFPSSRILLVESEKADFVWRSLRAQRKRLQPAVEVVKRTLVEDSARDRSKTPSILLVAMSDGGTNSSINLAQVLKRQLNLQALPIRALVLDSCPNIPHYGRAHKGFTQNLPKGYLPQLLGSIAVHAFLCLLVLLHVLGSRSQFTTNSRSMNSEDFIPKACPRVYIYSKADRLTPQEVVEEHCESAKGAGYLTRRVLFERSPHCSHVTEDRYKYWDAVRDVWKEGSKAQHMD